MSNALIQKLISVLDSVLKKLSRYDEGSFFAQILSLAVRHLFCNYVLYSLIGHQKPINEDGQAYVSCVNTNLEQLRQKISDEIFTLNIFEVSLVFRFEEKNPFFFKIRNGIDNRHNLFLCGLEKEQKLVFMDINQLV